MVQGKDFNREEDEPLITQLRMRARDAFWSDQGQTSEHYYLCNPTKIHQLKVVLYEKYRNIEIL